MNGVAMNTFTINAENNIAALSELPAGAAPNNAFASEKELAKVAVKFRRSFLIRHLHPDVFQAAGSNRQLGPWCDSARERGRRAQPIS
jgi:hypothetical protein